MDNYNTLVNLLYLRDQNLPVFRENRLKRIQSTQRVTNLIRVAERTCPSVPSLAFTLDQDDPEWDDDMVYPQINYQKFFGQNVGLAALLGFYGYNFNVIAHNHRLRVLRYGFPVAIGFAYFKAYFDYLTQHQKVALFDEYVNIRSQELIAQNSYLLNHEDFKKYVWWGEDFKETLARVHRQANNHCAGDFKDSELILQDFINRYTNPADAQPTNRSDLTRTLN